MRQRIGSSKNLIVASFVALFAITLFAPVTSARQWDPSDPPDTPWIDMTPGGDDSPWGENASYSGDDSPWNENDRSSVTNDNSSTFNSFGSWFDTFLSSIGVRYIVFDVTTSPADSETINDIQSGASNRSN